MGSRFKISLIIPVRDEERSIGRLLDSIAGQCRSPDEIVIADGGSKDRTVALVKSKIEEGMPVKLVMLDRAYPGTARNRAISSASHEWIAMTDAGITLDKNWLKELARMFDEEPDLQVVYGSYEPVTDSLFKECFALLALSAPVFLGGRWTRSYFIASSMIKKEVWDSVGGFPDLRAAEDKIFMDRIRQKRFKTALNPNAIVYWNLPEGFLPAFKKASLYSMHDLIAGRFNDWHRSVILTYIAGLTILTMGFIISPVWFFVLPAGILARAINIFFKKSRGKEVFYILNMRRTFLLIALMLWMDMAMFWGVIRYFSGRIYAARD